MSSDPAVDRLPQASGTGYALEREIGRGGMATVYLARDRKHERRVAVKVLHPELAAVLGTERFLQEVRVTATLQHPHILGLIDSGVFGPDAGELAGRPYYVMPYVDGESLRQRLGRDGQLPVSDAVRIAREVADALAYAHARGIVHRDVKPENILLHEGHAVVADFGIALAVQQAGGQRLTQTGLSLGTPAYMSPEQAMGERTVGPRSDVYALGAVTYEMLAGEPPFTGPSAQAIVARVMTDTPRPLAAQRRSVPPHVETAVMTALEKLAADRFATAAELGAALGDPASTAGARPSAAAYPTPLARRLVAPGLVVLGIAIGAAIGTLATRRGEPQPAELTRRMILDANAADPRGNFGRLAVSHDGRAFVALDPGDPASRLRLRRTDALEGIPVPGTEMAYSPFISFDGRQLGFVRSQELYTIPIEGGVATVVPNARTHGIGSPAFAPDGRIVFGEEKGRLAVIRPDGSDLRMLTTPGPDVTHLSVSVTPNGKAALFTVVGSDTSAVRAAVAAVPLDGGPTKLLVNGGVSAHVDGGHLVYVRVDGALMAAPFDEDRLAITGPARTLGDRVSMALGGVAYLSVGRDVILYQRTSRSNLARVDRAGVRTLLSDRPAIYHKPTLSPDGRAIALDIEGEHAGDRDVWIYDFATATMSRLTSLGDGHDPAWTPDGRSLTLLRNSRSSGTIVTLPADRSAPPRPFAIPDSFNQRAIITPGNWLPDGRTYLVGTSVPVTQSDIWLLSADGSAPMPLVVSAADEHSPIASPDGRWFAFVSSESGRQEVYVQGLAAQGARAQISPNGGTSPVWGRDGRTIYYLEPAGQFVSLIEVSLATKPSLRVLSRRQVIASLSLALSVNHANFDVAPDGRSFIALVPEPTQGLVVVTGWRSQVATASRGNQSVAR